jgi:hypothetical protein
LDVRSAERVVEMPLLLEAERHRTETQTRSSPAPPRVAPPVSSTAITGESPRVPDWHASAILAASAAVDRAIEEKGRRSFGPREQPAAPPKTPSIFETPKHKLGDVSEDAMGYTSVWLSDSCYTALEEPMSHVGRVAMILGATMCVYPIGKKPARGDLFDGMYTNEETER